MIERSAWQWVCRIALGGITFLVIAANGAVAIYAYDFFSQDCRVHVVRVTPAPDGRHIAAQTQMRCALGRVRYTDVQVLPDGGGFMSNHDINGRAVVVARMQGRHDFKVRWHGAEGLSIDAPRSSKQPAADTAGVAVVFE